MTPEQFERMAKDPSRKREELETMRVNALDKGQVEFARIAAEVLASRFPSTFRQRSGSTPTIATFRDRSETFDTGKDAYLWLLAQFQGYRKDLFNAFEGLQRK